MRAVFIEQHVTWLLARRWLVPIGVFIGIATLTFIVWHQQVEHQRNLLLQRTEDVCLQASRRLEVFVESHLRVASIFAQRWSMHEGRDFSRTRFEEFASVLVRELPGYHGVGLVDPELGSVWAMPGDAWTGVGNLAPELEGLLELSWRLKKAVLSTPFEPEPGDMGFFAVLPLLRGQESLGFLVVEFQADNLIDDCFHKRIRSDFHFMVQDGDQVLFLSSPEIADVHFGEQSIRSSHGFQLRNRTWKLTMIPREEEAAASGWTASLPIPLFGVALSVGLGWLVFQLLHRIEMFRAARNQQSRLSRKVLLAQEEERARLSRELHDELGQLLTATRLEMGWLEKRIPGAEDESSVFMNTVGLIEQATEELRRICRGLRPPLLDDLGFEPAVKLLVEEFQERTGIEIALDVRLYEEGSCVSPEVALCVYRILQESLTNISRHARASKATVSLQVTPKDLTLRVSDDGIGFDAARLSEVHGCGLEGMRERAHLVGGTVEIHSARTQGTHVLFQVSLTEDKRERTS